jgi:hypothetical protein
LIFIVLRFLNWLFTKKGKPFSALLPMEDREGLREVARMAYWASAVDPKPAARGTGPDAGVALKRVFRVGDRGHLG